jgi:hypothetical protein
MTVKDLHKILEDMMNNGLGDLEIRCASDCYVDDEIVEVDESKENDVRIWWG